MTFKTGIESALPLIKREPRGQIISRVVSVKEMRIRERRTVILRLVEYSEWIRVQDVTWRVESVASFA